MGGKGFLTISPAEKRLPFSLTARSRSRQRLKAVTLHKDVFVSVVRYRS